MPVIVSAIGVGPALLVRTTPVPRSGHLIRRSAREVPQPFVDEVRSAADIVTVISDDVSLRKPGTSQVGFQDVIRQVAQRFGVPVPDMVTRDGSRDSAAERESLLKMQEATTPRRQCRPILTMIVFGG